MLSSDQLAVSLGLYCMLMLHVKHGVGVVTCPRDRQPFKAAE